MYGGNVLSLRQTFCPQRCTVICDVAARCFAPSRLLYGLGWPAIIVLLSCTAFATSPQDASSTDPVTVQNSDRDAELQAHIASLIEQLGDDNYRRRRNAQAELQQIGLPAYEQLRLAAGRRNPNPEVSRAAMYLLKSQQVSWALETDSIQVRDVLEHYNALNAAGRRTRHQQLGSIDTVDALVALARLARFESSDELSKSAALELMIRTADNVRNDAGTWQGTLRPDSPNELIELLRATVSGSDRPGCNWILALSDDLEALHGGQSPSGSTQVWHELVQAEHAYAEQAGTPESSESALELYRWLGNWITEIDSRKAAVALTRECLPLVGVERPELREMSQWLLDQDLPELLVELVDKRTELFQEDPALSLLFAEGLLKSGNADRAEEIAEQTNSGLREYVQRQVSPDTPESKIDTYEASLHQDLGDQLLIRGMFPWATREYETAIELEVTRRKRESDSDIPVLMMPNETEVARRVSLGILYWEGGQNRAAADTLLPVVEFLNDEGSDLPRGMYYTPQTLRSNFHFYSGLAARDVGDFEQAAEHLITALQIRRAEVNPDILIALRTVAQDEATRAVYRKEFDKMADRFRSEVLQCEALVTQHEDRAKQDDAKSRLATACNQLAWLLGNCQEQPAEALQLSLRSLELSPLSASYLDTLARCYFANDRLDEAIATQRKAVKREPYQRQLSAQLSFFLEEKSKQAAAKKQP